MIPTPFHSRTSELCVSYAWEEWAGYASAQMYELEFTHEYHAVRTASALFDYTPLQKYNVRGPDATKLLDRVLTRNVKKCKVGQIVYSVWCDDEGKILNDGTLSRLGKNSYRLAANDPNLAWLEDNAYGMDVHIEDVTEELAVLSLQGPTSRDLLNSIITEDISDLRFFRWTEATIDGSAVTVGRCGFTGDLGYEIWMDPKDAERIWDIFMEKGASYALKAAGTYALDVARIEACLLVADIDYIPANKTIFEIQKSSPLELGFGWLVHLKKPYFVGQQALREEKERGPAWLTVGLEIDLGALEKIYADFGMPLHLPHEAWTDAVPIFREGKQIGKATSGAWSPLLKKYIAIARLKPEYSAPGSIVDLEETVEAQHRMVSAKVVKTPFFDPERKRT
jgi:aminomethyltransferase